MNARDRYLWPLLCLLLAAQSVSNRGCQLPETILPTPRAAIVHAVLVRETETTTPQLGALAVRLRQEPIAPHRLDILDQDQLPPALAAAIAAQPTPIPALYLLDGETGRVLSSRPLATQESVDSILASIREAAR